MSRLRYWFLGFRAGWWTSTPLPYGAYTARQTDARAYYSGYQFAHDVKGAFGR